MGLLFRISWAYALVIHHIFHVPTEVNSVGAKMYENVGNDKAYPRLRALATPWLLQYIHMELHLFCKSPTNLKLIIYMTSKREGDFELLNT